MLSPSLSKYFAVRVRDRGNAYFSAGAVWLRGYSDVSIYAEVEGSRVYDVCVDIVQNSAPWKIKASCTCRHADGGYGDACKHIWAAFVAADARRLFATPPVNVLFELVNDDHEVFHDERAEFGVLAQVPPAQPVRRNQPKQPAWSKLLSGLAAGSRQHTGSRRELPAASIEPIYILDGNLSRQFTRLTLSLAQQKMTASGVPGKIKKLSLKTKDILQLRDPVDREICLMLIAADPPVQAYGSYGYDSPSSDRSSSVFSVPDEVLEALLPLLFSTGRFGFRDHSDVDPSPLAWDDGPAWDLVLSIDRSADTQDYHMTLCLRRGDARRELNGRDTFFRGEPALLVTDGSMSRVDAHGCMSWIDAFASEGSVSLGVSDSKAVLTELARLSRIPPIEWPADWNVTQISDVSPQPELSLVFDETGSVHGRSYASGKVRFVYGDVKLNAANAVAVVLDARANCQIRRDLGAERDRLHRLVELGMEPNPYDDDLRVATKLIPPLIQALLEEGWSVLGNDKLFRRGGDVAVNVSSGIDWFELDARVDFDGQVVGLPELLTAAETGARFVRLGDGSVGMLPEQWLAKYGTLLQMGRVEEDHLRFAKTQIGLIDALLAQMPEASFDKNFAAARRKLADFDGIKLRKAPSGFRGTLRGYQEQGLAWLHFLSDFGWGGCLADDMGLGKTVQALAVLAERPAKSERLPSLLVLPKSIVFNWLREAERFAPKLRVLEYTGTDRKQRRDEIAECDVVLTTYGTMKRDIDWLCKQDFQYVILDEAQAIKNPASQNAKAARLLKAQHRLVMTGTPVENHLGDLWSLFEFLNPGMLGSGRAFKRLFGNGRVRDESPENLALLQQMLRPFILRRTKERVAKELPQRSEQTIECVMAPKQAAHYKEMRDYYRASLLGRVEEVGLAKSKVYVLEALLRLRQVACHPGLVDESRISEDSAKLESLLPMIAELVNEGHKALIFSQFTKLLAIVRDRLDKLKLPYEYLDGRTRNRENCVDRFQTDPDCPLFLISLKAGGVGLNLTAADYVFILDPWWNPAVEAQAIDRTHRIGQDKKVIAYRLIARNTVEAKILELQQSKRDLAGAIINQSNSLISDLTRDDLDALLS